MAGDNERTAMRIPRYVVPQKMQTQAMAR